VAIDGYIAPHGSSRSPAHVRPQGKRKSEWPAYSLRTGPHIYGVRSVCLLTELTTERSSLIAKAAEQYATGELGLRELATQYGVCHRTMRVWMMRELGPEYAHLQEQALLMRIAEADDKLDEAADSVSIARAREQCRYARWDAERRLPMLLGQRPSTAVQINGSGEMQVQIVSYASNNAPQQPVATSNDSQQDS
jgi:hypothetical protein